MQILFLFLAPLFFGCSKDTNTDNWKAPTIHFLNKNGSKLSEAKNKNQFSIDDYIGFQEDEKFITGIQVLGKSKCHNGSAAFSFQRNISHIPFQFKSLISPKAYLRSSIATCDVEVILKNSSGSTKTFTFTKRLSSEEHLSEINIPETIDYYNFQNTILLPTSIDNLTNNQFELHCEKLESHVKSSHSITLNELILNKKLYYKDIPIQNYYPQQKCRLAIQGQGHIKWSYVVTLNFKTLRPHFHVTHLKDFHYPINYIMHFSNPYNVSLSFGLNKKDFKFGATCKGACTKAQAPSKTYEAKVTFPTFEIVYGNTELYVITLRPGKSINVKVQVAGKSNVMASYNIVPDFDPKSVGAYDLEYNYRYLSEVGSHPPRLLNKFYPL